MQAYCASTFAFIQIVQAVMFVPQANKNYCHLEFEIAQEHIEEEDRILIVLAEASHDELGNAEPDVDIEFDGWYNYVLQKDKLILEHTPRYNPTQIDRLKKEIKKHLIDPVSQIRTRLIETAPD